MTSTNTTVGGTAAQTVAALLARSNELGSDPRNTNYAGGNTSAKGSATDPVTGEDVELLWVKGSGGDLGTLREEGLAVLRLDRVRALQDVYPGVEREDEMVAAFDHCLFGKGGAAPPASTPRCMRSSTPTMWTICIPMPGSRWRPRPTASV